MTFADWLRFWADRIDGGEPYAIGTTARRSDGRPMRRCTRCGIPRGTLRHATRCMAGACDDPDARLQAETP